MSHYKRKRPRTASTHNPRSRGFWLRHWPSWWDILKHTRPERRRARRLLDAIRAGRTDADAAAWPVPHRPHIYYW